MICRTRSVPSGRRNGKRCHGVGGARDTDVYYPFISRFFDAEKKIRTAIFILIAVGGGLLLSNLMKTGFDRPRTDLVSHGSYVYTASFPSGHSTMSAVTYLTLGALLARILRRIREKAYVISLALLVTVAVGISRVYLDVHWPTDVLAGWAMAWGVIAGWLQRKRAFEKESAQEYE
ncbi:MAG: phosphatase PAP2 family protein [Desulfobacterales bacterium]